MSHYQFENRVKEENATMTKLAVSHVHNLMGQSGKMDCQAGGRYSKEQQATSGEHLGFDTFPFLLKLAVGVVSQVGIRNSGNIMISGCTCYLLQQQYQKI